MLTFLPINCKQYVSYCIFSVFGCYLVEIFKVNFSFGRLFGSFSMQCKTRIGRYVAVIPVDFVFAFKLRVSERESEGE